LRMNGMLRAAQVFTLAYLAEICVAWSVFGLGEDAKELSRSQIIGQIKVRPLTVVYEEFFVIAK
jgi:hypothetical protein